MSRINGAIQEIQRSSDETSKIIKIIDEIAAACQEQAHDLDQVNTAIGQMDKVTQQNAANAEESASASEELAAQAAAMNDIVAELVSLVAGAGKARSANPDHPPAPSRGLAHSDLVFHSIAKSRRSPGTRPTGTDPNKSFPLAQDAAVNRFQT